MSAETVSIRINQSGESFITRNNLEDRFRIDRQPAGLNFYTVRWREELGTILFDHGVYSFEISHVLSFTGDENRDLPEVGIENFNIRFGVNADELVDHDEARMLFLRFIKSLTEKGWKPLIGYNYPRLRGKDAFRYYQEEDAYPIPPDYEPTLEEWMSIDFGYWRLFADNTYLSVSFLRDRHRMDLHRPGAYFLTMTISSKEERAKSYFQGEDRNRWHELWANRVKELKRKRYEKEEQLKDRGFTIFTEYEEPLIHPEDPVEP